MEKNQIFFKNNKVHKPTLKTVEMKFYKKRKKRVALDSSQFEDLNKNFLP